MQAVGIRLPLQQQVVAPLHKADHRLLADDHLAVRVKLEIVLLAVRADQLLGRAGQGVGGKVVRGAVDHVPSVHPLAGSSVIVVNLPVYGLQAGLHLSVTGEVVVEHTASARLQQALLAGQRVPVSFVKIIGVPGSTFRPLPPRHHSALFGRVKIVQPAADRHKAVLQESFAAEIIFVKGSGRVVPDHLQARQGAFRRQVVPVGSGGLVPSGDHPPVGVIEENPAVRLDPAGLHAAFRIEIIIVVAAPVPDGVGPGIGSPFLIEIIGVPGDIFPSAVESASVVAGAPAFAVRIVVVDGPVARLIQAGALFSVLPEHEMLLAVHDIASAERGAVSHMGRSVVGIVVSEIIGASVNLPPRVVVSFVLRIQCVNQSVDRHGAVIGQQDAVRVEVAQLPFDRARTGHHRAEQRAGRVRLEIVEIIRQLLPSGKRPVIRAKIVFFVSRLHPAGRQGAILVHVINAAADFHGAVGIDQMPVGVEGIRHPVDLHRAGLQLALVPVDQVRSVLNLPVRQRNRAHQQRGNQHQQPYKLFLHQKAPPSTACPIFRSDPNDPS